MSSGAYLEAADCLKYVVLKLLAMRGCPHDTPCNVLGCWSLYIIYHIHTFQWQLKSLQKKLNQQNHPLLGLLFKVSKVVGFGVHQVVPSDVEVEEAVIFATETTLEKEMERILFYHAI